MNKKILLLITMSLFSAQAWSGNVSIPNTFTDGTTASASEVNANFNSVVSAVNDNDSRINTNATNIQVNKTNIQNANTSISNIRSINVYVNGVKRGALIDSTGGSSSGANFFQADRLRVLLDSRYLAGINTAGDGLHQIALNYTSTDCSGQAYISRTGWNPLIPRQGFVFSNNTPTPGALYFVQAGTMKEAITAESSSYNGICSTGTQSVPEAYKVYINNYSLTGVSESDFVGEVTIGF